MSAVLKAQANISADVADKFWRAVLSKDRQFDGQFVFGVSSTHIYCRPSCAARTPRRENVTFFSLPAAAEQSGYRACLRCRPQETPLLDPQIETVQRACRLLEQSDERVGLDGLSRELGQSSFHLQRTFKNVMGITPRQYAEACRTARFRAGVQGGASVTAAMYDAGYGSSSRLYEKAQAELGMTPATYSRGGRDVTISYAIADSPLGKLIVAATSKGICAVRLGDSAVELERDLRDEYPAAQIEGDDGPLAEALGQIIDHLNAKVPRIELPLDIRATAFQRQVWEALRSIPRGETRSYTDIAKQIGRPKAVRAVARACATNPVALIIPCHRVVREDKTLGGYRWGIERKKKLLEVEREDLSTDYTDNAD
jgi:AraC family transcriptional regulator of adaptative response/methylated-DNA-[protein]-cysteine methyltransferase